VQSWRNFDLNSISSPASVRQHLISIPDLAQESTNDSPLGGAFGDDCNFHVLCLRGFPDGNKHRGRLARLCEKAVEKNSLENWSLTNTVNCCLN
jgi:hypothetical protein